MKNRNNLFHSYTQYERNKVLEEVGEVSVGQVLPDHLRVEPRVVPQPPRYLTRVPGNVQQPFRLERADAVLRLLVELLRAVHQNLIGQVIS